jgi:paraquat-inducible protein A
VEFADTSAQIISARAAGVVGCRQCSKAHTLGTLQCDRCGNKLVSRDHLSLQRVWAWWLVGLMCYVPANLYPMLRTRTLIKEQEDTIVGGAVELVHHGAYGIAAVILIASVAIPLGKFAAIALLAISVSRPSNLTGARLRLFHEVVECIGRWSMIDIFVVAILSSLVQLNTLAAVKPGPASLFFALSVIFTMLSAQSFDPRLIWDTRRKDSAQ